MLVNRASLKLAMLLLTIVLALLALWQVNRVASEVRRGEEAKVRLWAGAIGQRASLASATARFFEEATRDEQRKMHLYTDILQSFDDPDLGADLRFSLAYVNYIVDSSHTPIVITRGDSVITVPQELAGRKLEGELLEEYSTNPPFEYRVYGMPMRLYYKESENYAAMREVLGGYTRSFLDEITQNSILVPVAIVSGDRRRVVAHGNMDSAEVQHIEGLLADATGREAAARHDVLERHFGNDPIEVMLDEPCFVYYSSTPLLRLLRWLPLFWFFVAAVLLVVSYNLLRTARTAEQNRIWVGLAKETAHQLGTPISSLGGWLEYLRGKELTDDYVAEVDKDLKRLDTITRRFSKIGSTPELGDSDVRVATLRAVEYLQSRSPRRVEFKTTFSPDEEDGWRAPLNNYLFEWVVENLCKNAIDAMEGNGTITIVGSHDARKIYIDVSDTGKGMSTKVQRHIFDSGFTTKQRGWGLGLPLARRIVNQYHRGRLYLKYSIPGQGSCFRIELKKKL